MRFKGLNLSLALALSLTGVSLLSLSGCGGGNSDSKSFAQTIDATNKSITAIALEDNQGYVHAQGKQQFNLLGIKNGETLPSINISAQASWQLSDNSFGSISSSGLFSAAGKAGDFTLTASYAGMTKEQKVIVTDANLSSITISNANTSVDVCKDTSFSAQAHFEDGLSLDYPLTWGFKEVNSLASFKDASSPLMSSHKSGSVKVLARGKNNSDATIESNEIAFPINDTLTGLTLSSNKSLSMRNGESATLKVIGNYSNLSEATITANTSLSSSDTSLLSIDTSKGTITAKNGSTAGSLVTLTANCNGITSSLELKILTPELKSIAIIGPKSETATEELSISKNDTLTPRTKITYAGTDGSSAVYSGSDLEWSIDKTQSDSFSDSDINIVSTSGVLTVKDITLVQRLKLTLAVRLKGSNGSTLIGSDGKELKDTIIVYVNI
jgi:hypothetical protein